MITQDSFEALLNWLGPDREAAVEKFEAVRRRLIKIFVSRGCCDAEHLADEVFDRVCDRLPDIRGSYVGDPANYFHGVARKVYLESRRGKEIATGTLPRAAPAPEPEREDLWLACLRKCLKLLPRAQRELVLTYHAEEKRAKIDARTRLAGELGLTANALRLRAHRIRVSLEQCVLRCVGA